MPDMLSVCPCPTSSSRRVPGVMGTSCCSWVFGHRAGLGCGSGCSLRLDSSPAVGLRTFAPGMQRRQRGAFLSACSALHAKGTVPERPRGKTLFLWHTMSACMHAAVLLTVCLFAHCGMWTVEEAALRSSKKMNKNILYIPSEANQSSELPSAYGVCSEWSLVPDVNLTLLVCVCEVGLKSLLYCEIQEHKSSLPAQAGLGWTNDSQ